MVTTGRARLSTTGLRLPETMVVSTRQCTIGSIAGDEVHHFRKLRRGRSGGGATRRIALVCSIPPRSPNREAPLCIALGETPQNPMLRSEAST